MYCNCLIKKGADVRVHANEGDTPLHYAAKHGRIETSRLLLTEGADANARNNIGETALDIVNRL